MIALAALDPVAPAAQLRGLAAAEVTMPSGRVLAALAPALLLLVAFEAYCLVDLVRAPAARGLPKPLWALVILVVSPPFGALAYLVFGRSHDVEQQPERDEDGRTGPRSAARDGTAVR